MTIYATEVPMVGYIKFSGIHNIIWIHPFFDISFYPVVVIVIIGIVMTFQAFLVFRNKLIFPLRFFPRCLRREGLDQQKEK